MDSLDLPADGADSDTMSWMHGEKASDPGVRQVAEPPRPTLRGYRVVRYLGGGANGMVWCVARDSDGVRFAAKVLLADADLVSAELAVMSRLRHEHVLRLRDSLVEESGPCPRIVLITDLAEGGPLAQAVIERKHFSVGELVTVLTPIARALHDLHGQGLVHGDVSAQNVLLSAQGKPLLADFGVARVCAQEDPQVWGTPGFVAPEVLSGAPPTPHSDVYALGALAWTCLVGTPPQPPALRPHLAEVAPQAPARLVDLVLSCLSYTPQARPTAGDLALQVWQCAPPAPAPVPGSSGTRIPALAADPWVGLTQRIREEAQPLPEQEQPQWYRTSVARRAAAIAAVGGVLAGVVMVWPAHRNSGDAAAAGASSGAAASATTASSTAVKPAPRSKNSAARPTATASTPPVLTDPRGVAQRLVDARAAAWRSGDSADLQAALVRDSPAWQQDSRDLATARRLGLRYRSLGFTVRSAQVVRREPGAALLRVVLDRSAYRVTGAQVQQVSAVAGTRTDLTLQPAGETWRITRWEPVT
ncbi:protein kinase domain-containing protein [Dermacoccaceae bacterium W4C1]